MGDIAKKLATAALAALLIYAIVDWAQADNPAATNPGATELLARADQAAQPPRMRPASP